jgi:parvulin-like peptidyl-prolyl isomerase
LKRNDLSETLAEPAFALPVGEVSEVMETPYGFHIIKVESRIDPHLQPLEEAESKIRAYLRERKFRDDLAAFLERARSESEWCVKPKYEDLLSIPAPPPCERL